MPATDGALRAGTRASRHRDIACTSLDPPERRAQEKALLTRWNDDLARSGSERLDDTNERGRTLFDAMLTRALTAVADRLR